MNINSKMKEEIRINVKKFLPLIISLSLVIVAAFLILSSCKPKDKDADSKVVISEDGEVAYTFRPSSYFCPLAVSLSMEILRAVSEVEGVTRQKVAVEDYLQADVLVKLLDEVQDEKPGT